MPTAEATLRRTGLSDYWDHPSAAPALEHGEWKAHVYKEVDRVSARDAARATRMLQLSTARSYMPLKSWDRNPKEYTFSAVEEGRLGQHVPEHYLDDRVDLKGTRLKLLCRTGSLPVLERIGREAHPRWTKEAAACLTCNAPGGAPGPVEDIHHLMMVCPLYTTPRARMLGAVERALDQVPEGKFDRQAYLELDGKAQCSVLLGQRIDNPEVENKIDRIVKVYLKKAWNARIHVTEHVNTVLGTQYGVFKFKSSAI
jgi:hypothetical protein